MRGKHGAPARPLRLFAAPAVILVLLAFVSAGWSVSPRLTVERAITLALGIGAALFFAYASETLPGLTRRLFEGIAAGGIAVVVFGLAVYVFDAAAAVQPASPGVPSRWRGLGENPNTVAMLAGVDLGITLWLATTARRGRVGWALGSGALVLSILASQSRGGLLAGALGAFAIAVALPWVARARVAAVVAVGVVAFVGPVFVDAVTTPGGPGSAVSQSATTNAGGAGGGGSSHPGGAGGGGSSHPAVGGGRKFTGVGSSGRIDAWRRAFHEGNARPVLGFGFGTEERVFVPRFRDFQGRRPENSFLGLYLQLGATGVLLFAAVLVALAAALVAGLRRGISVAAPALAVSVAGALLFLVESYVYSIGNVATITFWVATAAAAAAASGRVEG